MRACRKKLVDSNSVLYIWFRSTSKSLSQAKCTILWTICTYVWLHRLYKDFVINMTFLGGILWKFYDFVIWSHMKCEVHHYKTLVSFLYLGILAVCSIFELEKIPGVSRITMPNDFWPCALTSVLVLQHFAFEGDFQNS